MTRSGFAAIVLSLVLLCSASAFANSGQLMDFYGLKDLQAVGNFYNGSGFPGTPNFGVTFSSNFFGLNSFQNGGSGNFSAPPFGPAIFMNGTVGSAVTGTINMAQGFSTGLNFFFTAGFTGGQTETVQILSLIHI